jgi:hypothetical protein
MRKWTVLSLSLALALAGVLLGAAAPAQRASGSHHHGDDDDDEIPFAEAHIFFELNHTDGDLGIHGLIDGDAWKSLGIEDPRERQMLDVRVSSRLRMQGLTEIFFESAEPTFDELPPDQFFRRFPEGVYEIEGQTLEGDELESEVELTHLMPAPPVATVNDEPMAVQCDADEPGYDATEVTAPVTIAWAEVALSHPDLGSPRSSPEIEIHNYQVVVEVDVETDDGEELTLVFSVDLPPGVTSMSVPEEFLELGDTFKYEVLVRERGFNQTAVESCFVLADD